MTPTPKKQSNVEQGMQLAADLPDVMPDQASEQVKPIYDSIQHTLRVPLVNLIFRTLANYPDYLEVLWKQLSPRVASKAFEQAADLLRHEALLIPVPDAPAMDVKGIDGLDKLRTFNDTIHYVLPKLLLVTTAFEKVTFSLGKGSGYQGLDAPAPDIPLGAAEGTGKVHMVDPAKAPDRVRHLFEAIKERHGHPLVSSYFRGLGNWPDFLEQTWSRLQPLVGTTAYEEKKHKLIAQAEDAVGQMNLSGLSHTKLNEEQLAQVRAILAAFRLKFIPEMLLDAALIKAMLDGAEAARFSRFSVASV